jgi:hypothetical protein
MPLALTVFGISQDGLDPALCYVLLRTVRGPGVYPRPTMPKDIRVDGISHPVLLDTTLELITWDKIISDAEQVGVQSAIDEGRLALPPECPVCPGQTITGLPFGPLIAEEEFQIARISGVGLLYRKGIATEGPLTALKDALNKRLRRGTGPRAVEALVARIGAASGIAELFQKRRPIGGVDYFYRAPATRYLDGPLFDVVPETLDPRTRAPILRVHLRRHAAPLDQEFTLQVKLGNYDDVLRSVLISIGAGVAEITVSAPAHITDVSLNVFDGKGDLVDQLNGQFTQGVQFGVSALGAIDVLPLPFSGAPNSVDLRARSRVHTVSVEGPSIATRSGGLDLLRKQNANVSALIGRVPQKCENSWFERGAEGQLEVIRWIKRKLEQPGLAKAYLVDPFLGSEALKRVVARQGNETAELFIVVSPGNIDPDADAAATIGGSDYLAKLISTATDWVEKLAGRITVVHVKRGDGSRQAFHDRYFCAIDQKGIPAAYLFSNSLSKAAGDWSFAICELDRVMSWRVYAYILEMIEGRVDGLQPEVIWKRANSSAIPKPSTLTASASSSFEPAWVAQANACLTDIRNIIIRNSEFRPQVGARVDAFLRAWPQDMDIERFADGLFKVVSHRDAIVVFVSDQLRYNERAELANILDDKLLNRFLATLPGPDQKGGWFVPFGARRGILENLGAAIARKENATNFLRAKFNPRVAAFVAIVETQRFEETLTRKRCSQAAWRFAPLLM